MTAPVLSDFQFQYGSTGVLLNSDNDGVTPFVDVKDVQGLDSATYRTSSKDTEGWDGSTIEAEFESKRTIVVSGTIYGQTHAQMESYIDSLKENFAVSKDYIPFYFKAPGVAQRVAYAKCTSGFRCNWTLLRRVAIADFQFTLECGDPIIYGIDEYMWPGNVAFTPFPGFSFPFGFPFDFGTVETGIVGGISAWNYGNRPAPFIATFTGTGVNGFGLLHEGLSRQVYLDLSIDTGDEVVVDFRKRSVKLNGSLRRGSVAREGWFLLQKGANTLRLLAGSGSLSVTLSGYDAWR